MTKSVSVTITITELQQLTEKTMNRQIDIEATADRHANALCNFIRDIRAVKCMPVLALPELANQAGAWAELCKNADIHPSRLNQRGPGSLYERVVLAARPAYGPPVDGAVVVNCWNDMQQPAALESAQRVERAAVAATVANLPTPGPGHDALWAFLAENGVNEENLAEKAGVL